MDYPPLRPSTHLDLWLDGDQWAPDAIHVALPAHRRVGSHQPRTGWGARNGDPFFPAGSWLSGDALHAGATLPDIPIRGIPIPCLELVVTQDDQYDEYLFDDGFVLGALLEFGAMKRFYLVMYHRDGVCGYSGPS